MAETGSSDTVEKWRQKYRDQVHRDLERSIKLTGAELRDKKDLLQQVTVRNGGETQRGTD